MPKLNFQPFIRLINTFQTLRRLWPVPPDYCLYSWERQVRPNVMIKFTKMTPYLEHSSSTSPCSEVSASSIMFRSNNTRVECFFRNRGSSITSIISIWEFYIMAVLALVFLAIKGVFIPCSFLPNPDPIFQPDFSIMFNIFS